MIPGSKDYLSFCSLLILTTHLRWKETIRNHGAILGGGRRILAVLGKLYLLLNCLAVGYMLDVFVVAAVGDVDVVDVVERHLLNVFLVVLVVRFVFGKSPFTVVRPFLVLPIRRKKIAALYLCRLLGGNLSIAPVVTAVAFCLKNPALSQTTSGFCFWLIGFMSINVIVAAIMTPLKQWLSEFRRGVLAFCGVVLAMELTDVSDSVTKCSYWLGTVFARLRLSEWTVLAGCLAAAIAVLVAVFPLIRRSMDVDAL